MDIGNDKTIHDLHHVLEISRSMAAVEDLDTLLGLVIDRSMELLDAERATLFLYDAATNELVSRIAAGVKEIRVPADKGVVGASVKTGATINVPDAYADPRFNPEPDRLHGFRTRSILCVPLRGFEGGLVGVLQVLNKRGAAFSDYDITLAETLAAQAGVAVQRAELINHYVQKQQMERAMMIARDIQRGCLPKGFPCIRGFDVAGLCEPADETGGDTYDFHELSDGRCVLVVADASGHGIGPALVIAETRAMLRAVSMQGCGVPEALRIANNLLAADLDSARFVTCFFGVLDGERGSLEYASAGHGPMLFYTRATDRFQEVTATALPLGVMPDAPFDEVVRRELSAGDFVVITTDGFFEAENKAGEPFGTARMTDVLRRARDLPPFDMIAALRQAVLDYTKGLPQADDLTAVLAKRL
jgi:phosphoserine phosphatase